MTMQEQVHEHNMGQDEHHVQDGHYHYEQDREALLRRMRRIEGQARGIQRMIEEHRYCPEIVQQLNSLSAAAKEVSLLLLDHHIRGCVVDAVREGNSEGKIRELMTLLRKAMNQNV